MNLIDFAARMRPARDFDQPRLPGYRMRLEKMLKSPIGIGMQITFSNSNRERSLRPRKSGRKLTRCYRRDSCLP